MPLLTSLEGVLDRLRGAGRTLEEVSQHWLQGEDHTAQASEKVVGDWLAVLLLEIRVAYDALTTLQGSLQGNALRLYRNLHTLFEHEHSIQDTLVSLNEVASTAKQVKNPHALLSEAQAEILTS